MGHALVLGDGLLDGNINTNVDCIPIFGVRTLARRTFARGYLRGGHLRGHFENQSPFILRLTVVYGS